MVNPAALRIIKMIGGDHQACAGHVLYEQRGISSEIEASTILGNSSYDLGRIFEEFHQLREAHTGNFDGFGLGLNIVKKYLQLMQGDIRVDSRPGIGATFTFTLPYAPAVGTDK